MVTNFDYLKNESKFSAFADVAISAERVILIDPEACILNCRRAMEFAVKWMYSVDVELEMPYQDNLQSLMNVGEYRQIVGSDIWKRMDYIRRCGNNVAHSNRKLGKDEAMLCLENLYIFLDYVAYCYAKEYEERDFNPTLITLRAKKAKESKEAAAAPVFLLKVLPSMKHFLSVTSADQVPAELSFPALLLILLLSHQQLLWIPLLF